MYHWFSDGDLIYVSENEIKIYDIRTWGLSCQNVIAQINRSQIPE